VIGNPEGLEGTVSDGIISAFRASRTMIQITAPVSPGSSGSPVLDESGNVIGIATQVLKEGQNLNFAISVEAIRDAIAKSSPKPAPSPARDSAEDFVNQALAKEGRRNFEGAIADYTEAIRLRPDFAETYYLRGLTYEDLKQYDKAISDYTEAIRLQPPKFEDAAIFRGEMYALRANAYFSLKQYGKAISDYTEAIRLWPDFTWLYEFRANAYDKLGNHSRAEQDRKKASESSEKLKAP
jgi:tetratricopeptide (TPR) repeat protein